jgi:hypothetical protein
VVLDRKHYALLIDRLDFLEDSLAARGARDERSAAVAWSGVRNDAS